MQRSHASRVGRWRLPLLLILGALPGAGCGRAESGLEVAARMELPVDSASSLHVDGRGRYWVGVPGGVVVVEGGAVAARVALPGAAAARVVGEVEGRVILHDGERLYGVDGTTGALLETRAARGVALLDVRGRYLFVAGASGEVFAHDPRTLEPVWAWAALGAPATALAAAPEGDRLFLALEEDGAGVLLTRDLQTGRVLGSTPVPGPLRALRADEAGDLLGVAGTGGSGAALALRPWGGAVELRWRTRLRAGGPPLLRYSPAAGRVAVLFPEEDENGLHVLDVETGDRLGSMREAPLDVAFDGRGALLLLDRGAVRVVRVVR